MKRSRLLLLAAALGLSIVLAVSTRDMVYNLIVVPLSYLVWQLDVLARAVPELVRWIVLVVVFGLAIAWQLVPELGPPRGREAAQRPAFGQVETVAMWLSRARSSNYFKWQVAHRLGRVARRLDELAGNPAGQSTALPSTAAYLDAGLNRSFMDFPTRRRFLRRSADSALDIDPTQPVDYLEAQYQTPGGAHASRR